MSRVPSFRFGVFLSIITGLVVFGAPRAQATGAFTDNFTTLLAELQSRSATLSNSLVKTEQTQRKACLKAIGAINKSSTSLATDLKTAGKVTKILAKAFPAEFTASATLTVIPVVFTNDLNQLIDQVFSNFTGDVNAALTVLLATVNGLPDGDLKIQALAIIGQSQQQILAALATLDYTALGKDLATALKDILQGVKLTTPKSSGGKFALSAKLDGVPWAADNGNGGGELTQSNGEFVVSGNRSSNPNSALSVYVLAGVTGTGVYSNGVAGTYTVYPVNYYITSGVVTITALDTIHHTATGSFSFSATDGLTTTVTATEGAFTIPDLTVNP